MHNRASWRACRTFGEDVGPLSALMQISRTLTAIAVLAMVSGGVQAQSDAALTQDITVELPGENITLTLDADAALALVAPEGESRSQSELAPVVSLRPPMRDLWARPVARWDDHPEGADWTAAVLSALRGHGAPLLEVVPRDIDDWCPGYVNGTAEERAAFWTGLMSVLAWHESTHRPTAVGGNGRWFGLVQIAPGTADWRRCDVRSGQALLNGPANLRCAIRIMAITVPRDTVVAAGMRGVAADWGPFHSRRKREDMRLWVRGQDYCQTPVRPVMRPEGPEPAFTAVSGPVGELDVRPQVRPEGVDVD